MRAALLAIALVLPITHARAATLPPSGVAACSGCHGMAGTASGMPPLAGRKDIAAVLQAFRNGTRPSTVMGRIARGFSDDEIAAIAAWYAVER